MLQSLPEFYQAETELEEVQPLTLQQQQVPALFTYKRY